MKRLMYGAFLLCASFINASLSPDSLLPSKSSIPTVFTVLGSQKLVQAGDRLLGEKPDCIFYIMISAPVNPKITQEQRYDRYKMFMGVNKEHQGPMIPAGFITPATKASPGIPVAATGPSFCLHFGWNDKGSQYNVTDAANSFAKALAQLHRNFKRSYNCFYIVATEGRSSLLLNYATQQSLKKESFSLSVVIELSPLLPQDTEKTKKDFYPNLSKIGTLYLFTTQHTTLSNPSYFPSPVRSDFPESFMEQHKNMYALRLLLNSNQLPLQNLFEGQSIKKSIISFGQQLFECCSFARSTYQIHRTLWLNLSTSDARKRCGIIAHPAQEKNTPAVKKEHQINGLMLEAFKKSGGSESRIEMKAGQRLRSNHRPAIAHVRRSEKFACQTA